MEDKGILNEVAAKASNRRSFVRNLGLASAALGIAGSADKAHAQSTAAPTDVDILNFALNLEYLESEFYTMATQGMTIDQLGFVVTGSGVAGTISGGSKVTFTDPTTEAVANEIASDERAHVSLLQTTIASLGGTAIARPNINLDALGFGFGSQADFLKLSRIFEDIGLSAYTGAAPLITNNTVLAAAAKIVGAEAEHVSALRIFIAQQGVATTALDAADIIPPPSGSFYFSLNPTGLTEPRTPQEVLYLAYNGANLSSGAFFPNGVNGNITTSGAAPAAYTGPTISASPNPIPVAVGALNGVTTITWNAPTATKVEIHVGSPTGPLFTSNSNSGSMATQDWVGNGTMFFLQDVSTGQALTAGNTLATVTVTLAPGAPTSTGSGSSGSTGSGSSGSTGSGSSGSTGSGSSGSTGSGSSGSTGSGSSGSTGSGSSGSSGSGSSGSSGSGSSGSSGSGSSGSSGSGSSGSSGSGSSGSSGSGSSGSSGSGSSGSSGSGSSGSSGSGSSGSSGSGSSGGSGGSGGGGGGM